MPAIGQAHRVAYLAGLQGQERFVERVAEHTLLDRTQVSADILGTDVIGVRRGQRGEVGARQARFRGQVAGLRKGSSVLRGRRLLVHLDQDMRGHALLDGAVPGLHRFIAFTQARLVGDRADRQGGRIDLDILDRDLLRAAVLRRHASRTRP